ncbi:hypothetical protein VTN02DRAFT_2310 [Thermoascus thermophilus]
MRGIRHTLWQAIRVPQKVISRNISITSRGEPIPAEDLFKYTNGRFLVNEQHEKSKRYAKFDVDALSKLVSSIPAVSSPISKIDKKEGGFNKALLMTAENGKQVIAKIPCPNMIPPEYATASEVAVLEFVTHIHSGLRSPCMELRFLEPFWGNMGEKDRFKLIQNLVHLERQLAAIAFPGYGNLYFRHWTPRNVPNSDPVFDVDDSYYIGPACSPLWSKSSSSAQEGAEEEEEEEANPRGPWRDLSDLGLALARRGIWNVKHSRSLVNPGPHYGSPAQHIRILRMAMTAIPILAASPLLQRHSKPVLWHTDSHLGNIFVSKEDPTTIVSIIDWQFTTIMPRFTQVRWPIFLNPPKHYHTGMLKPELPSNFDAMTPDEKDVAIAERDQAIIAKCYEAALVRSDLGSYLALTRIEEPVHELFTSCEHTYKHGIIPLRDTLIKISKNWHRMGLSEKNCPYTFTPEELARHERELAEYKEWHRLRRNMQQALHANDEGWVPPRVDFEQAQAKHKELFETYLRNMPPGTSEEAARKSWFYVDRE